MSQPEKPDKNQTVDNFVDIFTSFGHSIGEIFNDPALKERAREFTESASTSAKTLSSRVKDEEVKAKFRDVGKAAQVFGKSVVDSFKEEKPTKKHFTAEEASQIGEKLDIDWSRFDVEQFRMGLDIELEHGLAAPATNVTNDDPLMTGKITLAHLNEFPDYYTRLEKMEREAEGRE